MNLVINSQFRPFTYDEMVKPLVQYKEVYDKLEQDYSDLAYQTEQWKNIADKENNPIAYGMFNKYATDLAAITEDFSKGMNISNRRALLGMKRRYASDIEPIAKASKRREALIEEQRKANLNNPTMLWQKKASDIKIDDLINDPSLDYGEALSGNTLTAQVAASAGALAKEFQDNPEKMISLVGNDYYEYVKKRGFSSKAVLAAIMNNQNASPILTQLVENVIDASGVKGWKNESALQQAYNYARQGLWSAVGQDESQLVQNWRAQENLRHANDMAKQAAAHEMSLESAYLTQTASPYVKQDNTVGYYQPITRTGDAKSGYKYERTALPTDAAVGKTASVSGTKTSKKEQNPGDRILTSTGTNVKKAAEKPYTLDEVKAMGFEPVAAVISMRGGYQYGTLGDDVGDENEAVLFDKDTGMPKLLDPSNPNRGFMTTKGKSNRLPFGMSIESNLADNRGNIVYEPDNKKKLRYLSDTQIEALDSKAKYAIWQAAIAQGIKPGEEYTVFAVEGDDGKYSYLISKQL